LDRNDNEEVKKEPPAEEIEITAKFMSTEWDMNDLDDKLI